MKATLEATCVATTASTKDGKSGYKSVIKASYADKGTKIFCFHPQIHKDEATAIAFAKMIIVGITINAEVQLEGVGFTNEGYQI